MTLRAGARVGPYEVQSPLGVGGMGEVYRARDVRLERSVALKVLPESLSLEKERLHRFEKEARSASALNHPNIVTIYEVGTSEGVSYIAMELVEGKTLRDLLHAGALALRRLLPLAAQMADGLAKAHEAGIVHRDLKPENVMVTKDGLVKILDFGLAKLTQAGEEAAAESQLPTMTRATEPGTILGTVGYMSPEQASGRELDARSDQFSFGSILYEMATGKRAFEHGTKVQTLAAIIDEEPEAIGKVNPRLPANFCWIVDRCLAKDPEGRYASTKDLARDLAAQRDHASEIYLPGAAGPGPRRSTRVRRSVLAATAAAVVVTIAFFAGERIGTRRALEAPRPVEKPLTFRRGYITGARFAPDGQTVIYSAAWDGKPSEIFTTRIDSPESRPLGIFPAGIFAVSSTGEMAVSLGCEDRWDPCFGTLARVPLNSTAPREVLENVGSADWSPDGKTLAAIHVVEGKYRLEYPIGKVLYETEGFLSHLRVSPRGDLAFFEHPRRDSTGGAVCVVDSKGLKRSLTGQYLAVGGLLWGRDGDEVFFGNRVDAARRSVSGVNLSGRVRPAPWVLGLDDVSREGRFLFAQNPTRADIMGLTPGSTKERNLSWLGLSVAADLSNDGRTLLFFESGPGSRGYFSAYRRRTDGSDASFLGEAKPLALSPDEKFALAIQSLPAPHLALLPMGAGEPRSFPSGNIVQYHWAFFFPDGRRIGIAAEEKNRPVRSYVQDLDGGSPRPFGEEGMRATLVSPDGNEIAGSTSEGHFRYPASAGGPGRPIAGTEPDDFLVQWSADGKSLFVRGAEDRPLTLYRVDLASGKRERWKELAPPESAGFLQYGEGPRSVRVTPDGRFYVYTYWSRLGVLSVLEGPTRRW
jgi:hypothetical protein